jgi:hypothetical protein
MRIAQAVCSATGNGGRAVVALTIAAALGTACAPSTDTATDPAQTGSNVVIWEIGPEQVPCTGVAPQQCLRVRELPDGEWQLFYDTIAGFEYEPGFTYVVEVAVTPVANPPADASSLAYTLVRVLEKEPVGPTNSP